MVVEYAVAMADGAGFPPVIAFYDGVKYWLTDGFHRTHAARRATLKTLPAEIHDGTKRDAVLYGLGANSAHRLQRTNADKRKAVMTLLEDEEWSGWSDGEIPRHCAVHTTFVDKLRKEASLPTNSSDGSKRTYTNKHGTTSTMNTENIGKGAKRQVV